MSDVQPLGPDELLTTTRSVRKRLDLDRPVSMDLIRDSLEVALQAPSGSNQQGWHWLVITDAGKRARIGEYYRQAFTAYRNSSAYPTSTSWGDADRDATQNRVADSAGYLAEKMGEVPVLIIAAMNAKADLPAANQAGMWGSLLPAAWSLQLALRARGLGSAWTSLHLQYEKEIAELLGVPDHVRQGVLLPVAHFTGESFKPAKRQPLAEVLHENAW
ncbi:nitroreductase family protein [Pseudonocardia nantongensis]|uniref:nitroreductase family protein n=1 Tax=Pseudonocardia nantongensis TaxID=1181885 RepID=UPI00397BA1E4